MNELVLASTVFHVLCVILWIGGVVMITTILLPVIAGIPTAEKKIEFFDRIRNTVFRPGALYNSVHRLKWFLYSTHT